MAHEFGLDPFTLPERVSERQLAGAIAWLNSQWDVPSRSDWYTMVVACEVARVLSKDPNKIQPGNFKLPFTTESEAKPKRVHVEGSDGPPGVMTDELIAKYRRQMRLAQVENAGKVKQRGNRNRT